MYKKKIKYNNTQNMPWYDVEVISIDEVRLCKTEQTKTTFKVRELITNKERQCVRWSDKKLNVGDILQIQGWKKEDVFIVTTLLRIKRADESTNV